MRASTFYSDAEKTWISEMAVNTRDRVDETVIFYSIMSTASVSIFESMSISKQLLHKLESWHISVFPWNWLKCNWDTCRRRLSPSSIFTANVWRCLADIVVFRYCKNITKTFLYKLDVFLVILDTRSNYKTFLGCNVLHNELLENTGIKVGDVSMCSQVRHTKCVITICSS